MRYLTKTTPTFSLSLHVRPSIIKNPLPLLAGGKLNQITLGHVLGDKLTEVT